MAATKKLMAAAKALNDAAIALGTTPAIEVTPPTMDNSLCKDPQVFPYQASRSKTRKTSLSGDLAVVLCGFADFLRDIAKTRAALEKKAKAVAKARTKKKRSYR